MGKNTQISIVGVLPNEEAQLDSSLFGMERPSRLMAHESFDEL
jgi:hypothetical protein